MNVEEDGEGRLKTKSLRFLIKRPVLLILRNIILRVCLGLHLRNRVFKSIYIYGQKLYFFFFFKEQKLHF
jgi:hypothetical protein